MRRRIASQIHCLVLAALAATGVYAQSVPALPLLPNGVAYDAAGNLYFADTNRHQIYESSLAGVLTVVAGSGTQGFSGDGGPATGAQLNSPQGIAIGPDGTLYIADTGNQRIRAVSAGQITTFAGTGVAGYSGDNGPALAAMLSNPSAIAIDALGALVVCDTANHRVRRILAGTITTLAGNGAQGFAGDGAAATTAQLDTPSGTSAGSDGRIYIADSHNDRIRVIALDGTITTFAGSGTRGYAGDNGPATAALLSLPRGLLATSSGTLLFADSDNQRIRVVDAQGNITTVAGSGVQGGSTDGTPVGATALDTPRGVSLSTFGSPVFADAGNRTVRESVGQSTLYLPAGLALDRTSAALLSVPPSMTYGGSTFTVIVSGNAGTPQGAVQLLDGTTPLAQASLVVGTASFASGTLAAGPHQLTAAYLGDGINPATVTGSTTVDVTPAIALATANPVTIEYGQAIPTLTGSLSGILPQDADEVTAVYSTSAAPLSVPGSYLISASLTGPASTNYTVVPSPDSGSLQIDQAATLTAELPLAQSSYQGLPLVLTADVASTTQGTPTGSVTFSDGATLIASATLSQGTASATYASPAAGTHSIIAAYLGDKNFTVSSSKPVTAVVGAMPDFTVTASGSSTQTVSAGGMASYTVVVSAQPAPFTGVVSLSASEVPAGAVATFSPAQTVPGAGTATVMMNIQTAASSARIQMHEQAGVWVACLWLALPWFYIRRRSLGRFAVAWMLAIVCLGSLGCGARSITTSALSQQIYTVKVTGTGTNLAGSVVTHDMTVTLIVQ